MTIPSIQRHYLFVLAGLFWTVAGGILCGRAFFWFEQVPLRTELMLESLGAALAVLFYSLLFARIVHRNVERIGRLPVRAPFLAFTAWKGYLMIGFMIALGISLRSSSIPKVYLAIPYTMMGLALLIGSLRFYREFFIARRIVVDDSDS